MRVLRRPGFGQFILIQAITHAGAPVNVHGAVQLQVQRLKHNRFDRRKTGAPRQQDHRLVGFAQMEAAVRAIEAQDVAYLHGAEYLIGEQAARQVAHMQLQRCRIMRRVGDGEATALAVLEQNVDVLPGMELEHFSRGQTQGDDCDIAGRLFQCFDTTGQGLDRDIRRAAHIFDLHGHIGLRHGAAQQCKTSGAIFGRQGGFTGFTMINGARGDLGAAGAAAAVTTTVGHQQIVA